MVFEATQSFDLSFYVSGGFLMIAGADNYKFYGFYQQQKNHLFLKYLFFV